MKLSELIAKVKVTEDKGTIRDLSIDILGLLPEHATELRDEINEFLIHSKDYREFLDIVPAIERFLEQSLNTSNVEHTAKIVNISVKDREYNDEDNLYDGDNKEATIIDFTTGKEIVIIKPPV